MALRLQARYTLVLLTLIGVVALSLTTILFIEFGTSSDTMTQKSAQVMEADLLKQMEKRGALLTQVLAENLVNPVYLYDTSTIYELLKTAISQDDIAYAYVYGPNGRIIHDGKKRIPDFGSAPVGDFSRAAVAANTQLVRVTGDMIDVATPISLGNTRIGTVHVGISLNDIRTDISNMRAELDQIQSSGMQRNMSSMAVATLILMVFGGLLALFASRRLIHPIRKLAAYATQIGHGNYAPEIDVKRNDEIGELAAAFREMSENLDRTAVEIRTLSYYDDLTGLPNRAKFGEYLKHALGHAEREHRRVAVLFIDVDNFKRINDTLSHQAGDELLREFATRMAGCVCDEDYVSAVNERNVPPQIARVGGDEFTIVLPWIRDPMNAAVVASRIQKATRKPFIVSGQAVYVTASVGITIYPTDGPDADTLLRNADLALYHVKERGRDGYQYFADSMNSVAVEKLRIENDLRRALENDELELYYQPLIDARNNSVFSVEALLRWNHPQRGLVRPDDFVPIAESSGLIVPIGEWVLRNACRQLREWHQAGFMKLQVAVNVSSVQVRRGNLAQTIANILEETGLEPEYLQIELTETSLLHSEDDVVQILRRIKELGVSIWLDDFGTGFSSLSHLRRFPISGVKIDRSFVLGIGENRNDSEIASAIIAMAHNLNIGVIAEGVEQPEQMQWLRTRHCDHLQGDLFTKPLPVASITLLLERISTTTVVQTTSRALFG